MFVIDASVVASWCFPDESHPVAETALRKLKSESATTPVLLWFELRNVLLVGERRGRLSETQTVQFLRHVGNLPIEIDREPDQAAALSLARAHRLSFYDAAYLELAQRRSTPLATLDEALIDAARAEKIALIGVGS
jgi:predicted nucleic acid-binding protein